MQISLFYSRLDNEPKVVDVTWEELAETLSEHEVRAEKDGKAWSPTAFHGPRAKENAGPIVAAVFDLDDVTPDVVKQLVESLNDYTYVMHSTYSQGCLRLVLPLARPVPAADWPTAWSTIKDALRLPADEACKDASRLYYLPTRPSVNDLGSVYSNVGVLLDVGELVPPAREAPLSSDEVSEEPEMPGVVDMFQARTQLRKVRKSESQALVTKLLNGQSLAGGVGVNASMNTLAGIIAFRVRPIPEVDAAMELMRPCISATPDSPTGNLEIRMGEFKNQYTRAREQALKAEMERAHNRELLAAVRAPGHSREQNTEGDTWESALSISVNKDGESRVRPTGSNIKLILTNDPEWKGFIRYNLLTKAIEVTGGPLEQVDSSGWDIVARNWLEQSKYRINVKKYDVGDQLWHVAWEASYDPLQDYLDSLKWDGVGRVSNFFKSYYGATASSEDYLTKISSQFLISCVARALDPGCKMETVVVLQGAQGVGKSKSLKALAGNFFSDETISVHDKDSKALASRFWIIELAEIVSLRRTEAEAMKSFISRAEDTFRAPYARANSTQPRRCVFVGTTNEDEYLKDVTGNRRFWPVKVGEVNVEAISRDREQLWAEAVVRYQRGEKYFFSKEEAGLAEVETQNVMELPARTEAILTWWSSLSKRPEAITGTTIALDCLNLLKSQIDRRVLTEIGIAMKALGFGKVQKQISGIRIWHYTPPPELATAPIKEATVSPIRKS